MPALRPECPNKPKTVGKANDFFLLAFVFGLRQKQPKAMNILPFEESPIAEAGRFKYPDFFQDHWKENQIKKVKRKKLRQYTQKFLRLT